MAKIDAENDGQNQKELQIEQSNSIAPHDHVTIDQWVENFHNSMQNRSSTIGHAGRHLHRGYSTDTSLPMSREELHTQALAMNANLDRLHKGATPEEVFGKEWNEAFVSQEDIDSGKVTLHCGCMDERVPDMENGLKIGTAGSGILMTNFGHPRFQTDDVEEIYEFLADPESGDANFWAFIQSLKEQQKAGATIVVSDHAGCGAAVIFCDRFPEKKLDAAICAKKAALRLKRALGLAGEPLHSGYDKEDLPKMNRDPVNHDAHCLVIDTTNRFRADTVNEKLRGLKLSGISFLKDANNEEQNGYLRVEVEKGSEIIAGIHGTGIKDAPLLVITDPADPNSKKTAEERYALSRHEGRKIYFIEAPVLEGKVAP